MTSKLSSYPSLFALGHGATLELMKHEIQIEEKVDGSQFSFGVDLEGQLHIRSKGVAWYPENGEGEGMFKEGIQLAVELKDKLIPGYTYRGEYLQKPKHNVLAYSRTPVRNFILFDVCPGEEQYLGYEGVAAEAQRLGLEVVPLLYTGFLGEFSDLEKYLENISVLGGQKIEGIVIKPLHRDVFGKDKKLVIAKMVSAQFKEIHKAEWKSGENANAGDVVAMIANSYTTPARWNKAVIHLKEAGLLENSPSDIGKLMKEVPDDVLKECETEIKDKLFAWAWPQIKRKLTKGLPEHYKAQLMSNLEEALKNDQKV